MGTGNSKSTRSKRLLGSKQLSGSKQSSDSRKSSNSSGSTGSDLSTDLPASDRTSAASEGYRIPLPDLETLASQPSAQFGARVQALNRDPN